jgi:tetratricopeptide (TPR) repeat protein
MMMTPQYKRRVAVAIGIVLVGAALGAAWYGYSQGVFTPKPKIYTLADFPNANKVLIEQEELDRRIAALNSIYAEVGMNGGAEDSYHWLRIGTIKKILQDYVGAEEAWQKSLALSKGSVIYGNLANLYYLELDQPEKAIDYYSQAIAIAPENYSFYEDVAGVYRYKLGNQSDQIESVMLRGATANPAAAVKYYVYLADYFHSLGQTEKRDAYVQKILAENPDPQTLDYLRTSKYIK